VTGLIAVTGEIDVLLVLWYIIEWQAVKRKVDEISKKLIAYSNISVSIYTSLLWSLDWKKGINLKKSKKKNNNN
jgi:hypothetical protein